MKKKKIFVFHLEDGYALMAFTRFDVARKYQRWYEAETGNQGKLVRVPLYSTFQVEEGREVFN